MIALNSRFLLVYFSMGYGSGKESSIVFSGFFSVTSFLLQGVSFLLLGVISGSGAVTPLCLALVLSGRAELSFLLVSLTLACRPWEALGVPCFECDFTVFDTYMSLGFLIRDTFGAGSDCYNFFDFSLLAVFIFYFIFWLIYLFSLM